MISKRLMTIYERLYAQFGPQHWWPAESPFEVCVGAILTQNCAWTNVEQAITRLKSANALSPQALKNLPNDELAELIRPSGYFNLKALRIKGFVAFLHDEGDLAEAFGQELTTIRAKLLKVNGIGPETCDSILLYAGGYPTFVVDAYTIRIFSRLGLVDQGVKYEEMQALFMDHLPPDVRLFNEYHALIVALGKDFCRPRSPRCDGCGVAEHCQWHGGISETD